MFTHLVWFSTAFLGVLCLDKRRSFSILWRFYLSFLFRTVLSRYEKHILTSKDEIPTTASINSKWMGVAKVVIRSILYFHDHYKLMLFLQRCKLQTYSLNEQSLLRCVRISRNLFGWLGVEYSKKFLVDLKWSYKER